MKTSLIFGVPGQDSYFLIKLLEARGDNIIGIHRRAYQHDFTDFKDIKNLKFEMCDLTDASGVSDLIERHKPDEVYNLAAQSFVGISFSNPTHTLYNNIIGHTNLLESIRRISPKTKLYYAGSSEEFGNSYDLIDGVKYQGDNTRLWPVSPYGVSKVACRYLNDIYRKAYGLFICTAQNHNHSSFRRPEHFVFGKITKYAANLLRWMESHDVIDTSESFIKGRSKNGSISLFEKLQLGNVNAIRDESHASDIMSAAILMLSQEKPDDYVVCSGTGTSVVDILKKSFEYCGIKNYNDYWETNPIFFRELELDFLQGNCEKIKSIGWKPSISLDNLIKESINYHYNKTN